MAPPRRPGLTILPQKAPAGDTAVALIWTVVPVEHCTPAMLAFRATAEVLRVPDDAVFSYDGLPCSDYPRNPTMQHWQRGGAVLFGFSSSKTMKHGRWMLDRVYIARSGQLAVRDLPRIRYG